MEPTYWVDISMYQYASICINMHQYVSICINMYQYVSICINMYQAGVYLFEIRKHQNSELNLFKDNYKDI